MRKILMTTIAGLFLGTAAIAPVSTANADPRIIFDRSHDRGDDWRWRHRADRDWDRDDWRRGDRRWRRDRDWDDDDGGRLAAGIVGLAAGAIAGAALSGATQGGGDWHYRCSQKYNSYDPASGTYLGYDGYRHPCQL